MLLRRFLLLRAVSLFSVLLFTRGVIIQRGVERCVTLKPQAPQGIGSAIPRKETTQTSLPQLVPALL